MKTKRILALLLIFVMALSLASCGGDDKESSGGDSKTLVIAYQD